MKLRFGVLLLLIAVSLFMQQVLHMDLLNTILTLLAAYVIFFWLFNFFRKRVHETNLNPDAYIRINRIAAAYSRTGSKAETSSKLAVAQGLIDRGDIRDAKQELADVSDRMERQIPSTQHLYKIIDGYIHLFAKNPKGALKAAVKSPLDGRIHEAQKREVAFVRALTYLSLKDKVNAEHQIALLNEPKNNRQQLQRLFAYGWYLHLTGDSDRTIQAMQPIIENGRKLWLAKEAEVLKTAAETRKEYTPWTSVSV